MTSFAPRLREITKAQAHTLDSPDPRVVADAVIAELTTAQCRDALRVCLADWVRNQLSTGSGRGASGRAPSKADRVRSWYARKLNESLFVGTEWKFLRDCTADDLHAAATERYRKAAETHAEGDRWAKVAIFMEEADRATVADLTEDELKQLLASS